jgi:pimeloyl-ACP methyl ester carboxylesterase
LGCRVGRPTSRTRPRRTPDRLRAFVEKLGLRRFTLVAHDFGGPIALAAGARRQREPGRAPGDPQQLDVELRRRSPDDQAREDGVW